MLNSIFKSPITIIIVSLVFMAHAQSNGLLNQSQAPKGYQSQLANHIVSVIATTKQGMYQGSSGRNIKREIASTRAGQYLNQFRYSYNIIQSVYRQKPTLIIAGVPSTLCLELNRYPHLYINNQAIADASFNLSKCFQGVLTVRFQ
jgi:hypothetical protein